MLALGEAAAPPFAALTLTFSGVDRAVPFYRPAARGSERSRNLPKSSSW